MSTQITNKQVKIVSNVDFNNHEIENAIIDASKNTMSGIITELTAGNGINIDGNTISLKGTVQLDNGTDIDTIITEGNYFIDSPTSTLGLPKLPEIVMVSEYNGTTSKGGVSKWLCLLLVEKQYGYGTYFVRQTATFTPIVSSGVDYIGSDTLMFTRILSDSTYPQIIATHNWTKIDGDRTRLYFGNNVYDGGITISKLSGNYTYMVGFTGQYLVTSLTLNNIADTPNEIQVVFKVRTNTFTLTAEQLQILNYDNIKFENGKTYILTIKNLYATIDCIGDNTNLKTFVDKTIVQNDLQKKLIAGNNITITNYGWQGFSTTNNLELNTEHDDYVNLIKFNLNELNKNSTIFYSRHYDENLSEVLNTYLDITNENKLHVYGEVAVYDGYNRRYVKTPFEYTGTTVLQANKYYWIKQVPEGSRPQMHYTYLIEDDNYIVNTLPDISQWTEQFFSGARTYNFISSQNYPLYIGYNPVNNNYFSGVIQEFITNNFNLSTAVEGTDFINNGCVNGSVISATGSGSSSNKTFDELGIIKITNQYTFVELAQEIQTLQLPTGTIIFGEVTNTGLPNDVSNAEVKVEILDTKTNGSPHYQVMLFTLCSSDVNPYQWIFVYYQPNYDNHHQTWDWIPISGGGGSSYTAGGGLYIDNNEIGMNRNTAFYNHLYINSKDDNIQDSDISFDESTFFTYTGGADNNFYNFIYMNGVWNLRVMDYSRDPQQDPWDYVGEVDLADYGITYLGTPFENGWFILAGNYLTGKTNFTVVRLSFSNVFLNGILLTEDLDFTRNDNTITFIDYILKATDRIQVI